MNKGVNYSMFYDILLDLREDFHSYGRIDDSNAKLDEIIKLICTSYSMALSGIQFSLEYIQLFESSAEIADVLKSCFMRYGTNAVFGINKEL